MGYIIPDPSVGRSGRSFRDQYIIAALRERDGTPLWRVQLTSHSRVLSQPKELAIADGVLLVLTAARELDALRASDGAFLWQTNLVEEIGTAWGGVLYSLDGGAFYALRLGDGHLLWQHILTRGGLLTRLVADGTNLYFAQQDGSVTALRADTGAVRWTFGPATPTYTPGWYLPFAAANGQVYLTYLTSSTPDTGIGVVRLSTEDGTSDGYVLHLPTASPAEVYPLLAAGVLTVLISPPPTRTRSRLQPIA